MWLADFKELGKTVWERWGSWKSTYPALFRYLLKTTVNPRGNHWIKLRLFSEIIWKFKVSKSYCTGTAAALRPMPKERDVRWTRLPFWNMRTSQTALSGWFRLLMLSMVIVNDKPVKNRWRTELKFSEKTQACGFVRNSSNLKSFLWKYPTATAEGMINHRYWAYQVDHWYVKMYKLVWCWDVGTQSSWFEIKVRWAYYTWWVNIPLQAKAKPIWF